MLDAEALADLTAEMVREHVARSIAPLLIENSNLRERIAVLESKGAPEPDSAQIAVIVAEQVAEQVTAAVAAIPAAKDGQDADPEHVARMVAEAVAAIPTPKDGAGVTVDDLTPVVDEAVAKAVAAIPAAKDGVGLAGALIDRAGSLVVTLTDGSTRELGQVVGRDADADRVAAIVQEAVAAIPKPRDGDPGADADPEVVARMVADAVAQIPAPKDGKDGVDAYPGEARGLFDGTATYRALDVVSFNGSEWRAKFDEPGELPGNGWMLSACRGKKGEPGKGVPGANLVAAYVERDTATLVMTRDDGVEIKADLSALVPARDSGHFGTDA